MKKNLTIFFFFLLLSLPTFAHSTTAIDDLSYCNSSSDFPWHEWIAGVKYETINNSSGKSTYSDFTNQSTVLLPGSSSFMLLTTGFSYFTYNQYWRVWIDFNQDGDFDDAGEIVFSQINVRPPDGTAFSNAGGLIDIPATAPAGATRMRIAMQRGSYPDPCSTISFGEVEDYKVEILPLNTKLSDLDLKVTADPTTIGSGVVTYTLKVSNHGPDVSQGIEMRHTPNANFASYQNVIPAPGTSFSQGTKTWNIPSLVPTQHAIMTFEANVVDLVSPQFDFFEIITAPHLDPDSAPNNDQGDKTADEDDEAIVYLNPANLPDLSLNDFNLLSPQVDPGAPLNFNYSIANIGDKVVGVNENIFFQTYLSTDDQLSSDDLKRTGGVLLIPLAPGEENTSVSAMDAPSNLPEGDYFLIFSLDDENLILEKDETNNVFALPFHLNQTPPGVYCNSLSNFPWEDWIAGVDLGNFSKHSAKSEYSDFTAQTATLLAGQATPIGLTTGFSYFTWDEYWRIWIDFNEDGDFNDPGEIVFSGVQARPADGTFTSTLNGMLNIPPTANPVTTRMRISMKRGAYAEACEVLDYGEVEDYTVKIDNSNLLPDLRIPSYELIPGGTSLCYTNPGENFAFLGGTIVNFGLVDAGAFKLQVSLSEDDQPSANDVLWETFSFSGLTANTASSFSVGEPVPDFLSPGKYYVFLTVDSDSQIAESDETNNRVSARQTIGAPDFSISNYSGNPLTLPAGSNAMSINVEVTNHSPFPFSELSGDLTLQSYLSTDAVFSSSDDQLIGSQNLDFNQFSNAPFYLDGKAYASLGGTIPASTSPGDYFLFLRIRSNCEQQFLNNFSEAIPIQITAGTFDYCDSYGDFPWQDWIAKVEFANLSNSSGKSKYSDFSAQGANLNIGDYYQLQLTTGFSYFTWDEYWSVWIDFNQDKIFQASERLNFPGYVSAPSDGTPLNTLSASVQIPLHALPGATRMRVSMKRESYADPCEIFPFGEVEDYTVYIGHTLANTNAENRRNALSLEADVHQASIQLSGVYQASDQISQVAIERSTDGKHFTTMMNLPVQQNLEGIQWIDEKDWSPAEGWNHYRLLVQMESGEKSYSLVRPIYFAAPFDFSISPNPAIDELFVYFGQAVNLDELQLSIYDAYGRLLMTPLDPNQIEVSQLKGGLYFLQIQRPGRKMISRKFMVSR